MQLLMMERLRYLLILLLFVLAGSLQNISSQDEVRPVAPSLVKSSVIDFHLAVSNYLSAEICVIDSSFTTPVVSLDHKAVLRQRSELRSASARDFDVRTVMRLYSRPQHDNAVDYYIFSLGHILI